MQYKSLSLPFFFFTVFFFAISFCKPASAQDTPCSTPRSAVASWLDSLQPESMDPKKAVTCFDWADVKVPTNRRLEYATQLKEVLDLRGHFVLFDDISDSTDAGGKSKVFLFTNPSTLQEVWLEKKQDQWLFPREVIQTIPELYKDTVNIDISSLIEELPSWMKDTNLLSLALWQWAGLLLFIFFGFLFRSLIAWLVATQGLRLIRQQGENAPDSSLKKAAKPIGTLIMAGFLWYVLPLLHFSVRINQITSISLRVIAAASGVAILYRLVDVASDIFAKKAEKTETKLDDQLVPLARRTLKAFVITLGVIFVLQNMDVDVGSLLAGASLGGLAFTLAAKDTVANLFGSFSIFADRPFQIGDWVVINQYEGVVEEVGMRSTRVRTFYNSVISIPNASIANSSVDNYGARNYRRTKTILGVTYDTTPDQIQAFCEGIRAILKANPKVRQDYYEVHFQGFGSSALEILLYFFFSVQDWSEELEERHKVFLEIIRLAQSLNIDFAFPTQTLHVDTLATQTQIPQRTSPQKDQLEQTIHAFGPRGTQSNPQGSKITHGYFADK